MRLIETSSPHGIFDSIQTAIDNHSFTLPTVNSDSGLSINSELTNNHETTFVLCSYNGSEISSKRETDNYLCSCSLHNDNSDPYLQFMFSISKNICFELGAVISKTAENFSTPELNELIIAKLINSKHTNQALVYNHKLKRLITVYSYDELDDISAGRYTNDESLLFTNETLYTRYLLTQPLDVSEFIAPFLEILHEYGFADANQQQAEEILSLETLKIDLFAETGSSISDTYPRDILLDAFEEFHPQPNSSS